MGLSGPDHIRKRERSVSESRFAPPRAFDDGDVRRAMRAAQVVFKRSYLSGVGTQHVASAYLAGHGRNMLRPYTRNPRLYIVLVG